MMEHIKDTLLIAKVLRIIRALLADSNEWLQALWTATYLLRSVSQVGIITISSEHGTKMYLWE